MAESVDKVYDLIDNARGVLTYEEGKRIRHGSCRNA